MISAEEAGREAAEAEREGARSGFLFGSENAGLANLDLERAAAIASDVERRRRRRVVGCEVCGVREEKGGQRRREKSGCVCLISYTVCLSVTRRDDV
eukprot:1585715-Rhodomonas_salina.1